ncbi:MAG: nucleoside monophosphate kinase [Candidatus Moranbacteria bacterium]|nr:nucleoside monophosphate kinase [Candidatus Moranbacteria bacterium]
MNIIIFGPQGSGKGTQADLLCEKYNLAHIETGLIFREISREESDLGRNVKEILDQKEMIPDDITLEVLEDRLEKVSPERGVLLDSAPRTSGQIVPVEKMLQEMNRPIDKAIYITLPYDESVRRITKRYACTVCYRHFVLGKHIHNTEEPCPTCGGPIMQRNDDTPDGIKKRLDTFYEITIPVIEHYRHKGMLIEVDGNRGVEEVFGDIVSELE